ALEMHDLLGQTANVGRDHRYPGRHRLEARERERVLARSEHEDLPAAETVRCRAAAEKLDRVTEAVRACEPCDRVRGLGVIVEGGLPDVLEAQLGPAFERDRGGFEEDVGSLRATDGADRPDRRRDRGLASDGALGDAVVRHENRGLARMWTDERRDRL